MEYHSGGSLPLLGRPRYCPGTSANGGYLCETGHCCGETGCCTYYYELWWFWLLWTVLILFSCCCAYRHRRAKLRVQQQQRQREISLLAYHGASSYPSSMLDLSFLASLKLPSYEEVAAQPSTPPPPYSSVFTTPRYPQPPRTSDPHLLTQHGPLLHRPLSDGPSSLSSDNSSSCSCDSCCPSSPCSSSLSAPVTYETDTSHATTPSEAAPLALDVTMETIAGAASCLEVNERRSVSEGTGSTEADDEDAARTPEPTDPADPNQMDCAAVPLPSPGSDMTPPDGTTSLLKQQLDPEVCPQTPSTCSPGTLHSPGPTLPSILTVNTDGSETSLALKAPPTSVPSTPTGSISDRPEATRTLDLSRPSDAANPPCSPTSIPSPGLGRTLVLVSGSVDLPAADPNPSIVPILKPILIPSNLPQPPDPVPSKLTPVPNPPPKPTIDSPNPTLIPKPTQSNLTLAGDAALSLPPSAHCQMPGLSPGSGPVLGPTNPNPGVSQHQGDLTVLVSCIDSASLPAGSGPALVRPQSSDLRSPLTSEVQAGFRSESGSCSSGGSRPGPLSTPAPLLTLPTPAASSSSCPAITIAISLSPPASLSPSSPPSLPSPPSPPGLSSVSLPAPALLLDPLTALHQSNKGGSSGHASSLSPSPRATQSPPKQTLFSPCVDVFEPGPPSWEDGEDDDDEDEDMGADESQYRHRRLTGDSGIEVCRCRVEEEEEEEVEEEEECKRGGGERDKKGSGNSDLHDSADCPARSQETSGDGLTLCNAVSTTSEDGGKVVIVMETV